MCFVWIIIILLTFFRNEIMGIYNLVVPVSTPVLLSLFSILQCFESAIF